MSFSRASLPRDASGGFTRRALITKFRPNCCNISARDESISPSRHARRFNCHTMIRMYHCRAGHGHRSAFKYAFARAATAARRPVSGRRTRDCIRRAECERIQRRYRVVYGRYRAAVSLFSTPLIRRALLVSADHYSIPEIRGRDRSIDRSIPRRDVQFKPPRRAAPRRPPLPPVPRGALCRVIAIVL